MFGGFPFEAAFGGGHSGGGRRKRQVDNSKFYDLLGVPKDASDAEIKKAFRKQAMQHHPDKGGDPEKFKEISKAYEILSDAQKRSVYDEHGEEGLQDGGGGSGMGGMDIFDLFGMGGGGRAQRGPRKGEDVVFPLKVTLEDLYNGVSKKLRLTKDVLCTACKGKGGAGGAEVNCRDCNGRGQRIVTRQVGPGMIQQMQMQCSTCHGQGRSIAEKDKCKQCHGEKTVKEQKTLEVFVTKGMRHGERIVFSGEGDEAPNTLPGDVIVVLQQNEHPNFKRDGSNLFYKKSITLLEALTGFKFTIQHLDGRLLLVKSEPAMIVKPGDVKKIQSEGFCDRKNPFLKGDLYVELDVIFPDAKQLSDAHRKQLMSLLPTPSEPVDVPMDEGVEEVVLTTVDFEAEKKRFEQQERQEAYEAGEEEETQHHGPQAQCRQQ